jgi:hypothetical protein
VRLPEFTRSTTFRWTLAVSGAFIVCILLMFGFILAQAYSYMTTDVDALNNEIANAIASHEPEQRILGLDQYLRADPHHVKLGGLFAADGRRIAGNIETLPPMLHGDAGAQLASLIKIDDGAREQQAVRAVARGLPEGGTLVIARSDYEFTWIVHIVERALAVGLIPALCLSLAVGVFLSIRAQKRIEEVNSRIQRIVAGELRERLPARGTDDPFDKLAELVNGMLDEIEVLVRRLAGVGDDIAHDLRTRSRAFGYRLSAPGRKREPSMNCAEASIRHWWGSTSHLRSSRRCCAFPRSSTAAVWMDSGMWRSATSCARSVTYTSRLRKTKRLILLFEPKQKPPSTVIAIFCSRPLPILSTMRSSLLRKAGGSS